MGCVSSKSADQNPTPSRQAAAASAASRLSPSPPSAADAVVDLAVRLPRRENVYFEAEGGSGIKAKDRIGITLAGVKALQAEVLRFNSTADTASRIEKTRDISTKIVKPATRGLPTGQQAYVHLQDGKHRGAATCFVSHTWQAEAGGLLEAVVHYGDAVVADGGEAPVFYLDIASVDQHQTDQVSRARRWR